MTEPDIDAMVGKFMSNGWGGLTGIDAAMTGAAAGGGEDRRRVAEAMARLAATPDGEIVLDHLLNVTVRRSTLPLGFVVGEQPLTFEQLAPRIVWREAQNALAVSLVKLVEEGRAPSPRQKGKAK